MWTRFLLRRQLYTSQITIPTLAGRLGPRPIDATVTFDQLPASSNSSDEENIFQKYSMQSSSRLVASTGPLSRFRILQKFTPEEDRILLDAFKIHGPDFALISSKYLPHRPTRIISNRWNTINPAFKRSAWTPEEDQILIQVCYIVFISYILPNFDLLFS